MNMIEMTNKECKTNMLVTEDKVEEMKEKGWKVVTPKPKKKEVVLDGES